MDHPRHMPAKFAVKCIVVSDTNNFKTFSNRAYFKCVILFTAILDFQRTEKLKKKIVRDHPVIIYVVWVQSNFIISERNYYFHYPIESDKTMPCCGGHPINTKTYLFRTIQCIFQQSLYSQSCFSDHLY